MGPWMALPNLKHLGATRNEVPEPTEAARLGACSMASATGMTHLRSNLLSTMTTDPIPFVIQEDSVIF